MDDIDFDEGLSGGQSTAPSESPPPAIDTSLIYRPERRDLQRLGEPILITQRDFDDMCKEAQLSERQKEIFGSRLSDHNCLDAEFRTTAGRKRCKSEQFDQMYRTDTDTTFTYCWNIRELFVRMKQTYNSSEWRLLMDQRNALKQYCCTTRRYIHPCPLHMQTMCKHRMKIWKEFLN